MTRFLTYREAAEESGIGQHLLRKAAASGELVVHRFGHKTVLIDPADLEAYQRRVRAESLAPGPAPAANRKSPGRRNPVEEAILRRRRRNHREEG